MQQSLLFLLLASCSSRVCLPPGLPTCLLRKVPLRLAKGIVQQPDAKFPT